MLDARTLKIYSSTLHGQKKSKLPHHKMLSQGPSSELQAGAQPHLPRVCSCGWDLWGGRGPCPQYQLQAEMTRTWQTAKTTSRTTQLFIVFCTFEMQWFSARWGLGDDCKFRKWDAGSSDNRVPPQIHWLIIVFHICPYTTIAIINWYIYIYIYVCVYIYMI